jgi:hypothetical protein
MTATELQNHLFSSNKKKNPYQAKHGLDAL